MAGLYLHIPFCKQACHYCDFHFSTSQDLRSSLVSAMAKELHLQKDYLEGEAVSTLYFGGGTPSILNGSEWQTLFNAVSATAQLSQPEVTVEANPDDLTKEKLIELKGFGVNRLSIGIQSFDDHILKFMNRAHDHAQAIRSVEMARSVGFENLSIDLMYAIPGQSISSWEENIDNALALRPEHVSAYSLTIERKTAFGNWQNKGTLKAIDDDEAAEEFELLMDKMAEAGYEHYEISNFCLPGFQSRHNTSYWQQKKYLGIGPSAHSYNGDSRQFNVSNNAIYDRSIAKGEIPFEREILSRENKINEFLFTSLRTSWGCNLDEVKEKFQYDIAATRAYPIRVMLEKELATLENNTLVLTRAGKLVADTIAVDLFIDSPANS